MRIGLFIACFIDAFTHEVSIATLELLERVGLDVLYSRDQTCYAQPMANAVAARCARPRRDRNRSTRKRARSHQKTPPSRRSTTRSSKLPKPLSCWTSRC
jgi:Fe-S oxidoreductase